MTINYIIFTQEDVLPKPKQQQQQQQVKQDSWRPKVGWLFTKAHKKKQNKTKQNLTTYFTIQK